MKIKSQSDGKCLNCGANLQDDDQFCPRCGQKVDRNDLRIGAVLSEFFENYLSLDSRLGRTLVPFFFKPGYLSERFVNGVRRNYANPFRLYIFTSIFFFFCLNANIDPDQVSRPIVNVSEDQLSHFTDLNKEEREELEKKLSSKEITALNQSDKETFKEALLAQKTLNRKRILKSLNDSLADILTINRDSLIQESNAGISFNASSDDQNFNIDFDLEEIEPYMDDPAYTDEMLYDSLRQGKEVSTFDEIIAKRMIKVQRAEKGEVSRQILGNLSLAMFILLPLFAFFMKLFYWRRNKFYVAHLIQAVYLQSFAFLLFGLAFMMRWLDLVDKAGMINLFKIAALIFAVYFIASFRRIYRQNWFKLLVKSFLLFGTYIILSVVVLLVEILVSFLFF